VLPANLAIVSDDSLLSCAVLSSLCVVSVQMASALDEKGGASGGAGSSAKAVPGAPNPAVLGALDLVLREWTRLETDRLEWVYAKAEMTGKIERLEKLCAEHERSKAELVKRLQALEFGLRQVCAVAVHYTVTRSALLCPVAC
jgi:hypothetical protein